MDKIWIKDLEIFAYHGVLAEEKPDLINDRRENEDTGVVIEK